MTHRPCKNYPLWLALTAATLGAVAPPPCWAQAAENPAAQAAAQAAANSATNPATNPADPAATPTAIPATCATVEVLNVRPGQGHLMVAAYADAGTFLKTPSVSLRLPAGDATMRFQLCGLAGNSVALALFQDLDSDGKMGSNLVGMPTEPWGSSGSPGAFGPTWDTARVARNGATITVRLSQ